MTDADISQDGEAMRFRVVVSLDNGLELAFPAALAEGLDQGARAAATPAGEGTLPRSRKVGERTHALL